MFVNCNRMWQFGCVLEARNPDIKDIVCGAVQSGKFTAIRTSNLTQPITITCLTLFDPEDKGIMIIQNVSNCLPDIMAGYSI